MPGGPTRLLRPVLALLLLPATVVAGDDQKDRKAPRPNPPGPEAAVRREAPRSAFRQNWIASRYQQVVAESRKREKSIERTRKRIEQDLGHLQRARTLILRCDRTRGEKDAPDPVLQEVSRIRLRLRFAAWSSRALLRQTVTAARQSLRQFDQPRRSVAGARPRVDRAGRPPGADSPPRSPAGPRARTADGAAARAPVDAQVAKAAARLQAAAAVFQQSAAAERRAIAALARRTSRVAQEIVERAQREAAGRGAGESVDARRALIRLRQMEAARRQSLRRQGEQDARKIDQRRTDLATLEKRLAALKAEIERLKTERAKSPRP
jgi:hypothetical protein